MTLTVHITDHLQMAGATAAWIAANHPDQADAQAYLQRVVEEACTSYASQFDVDRITSGDFVLRFTAAEHASITIAAQADATLRGFLDAVRATPTVRLAGAQVTSGLAYLVNAGLLTPERAAEVAFYPIPVQPDPVTPAE